MSKIIVRLAEVGARERIPSISVVNFTNTIDKRGKIDDALVISASLFGLATIYSLWRFAFREAMRDRTRAQRTPEFMFTFTHGFVLAHSLFSAACNLHSQLNLDKRIYYRKAFSM